MPTDVDILFRGLGEPERTALLDALLELHATLAERAGP